MKRKMLAGLLAVSLCLSATGCGNGTTVQSSENAQTAQSEAGGAATDHMILDGIKGEAGVVDKSPEELKKDARESGISYAYEENCDISGDESGETQNLYLQRYELYLKDDGQAKLYDISDYGNGHTTTSEYLGTAEKSDGSVVFSFQDNSADDGHSVYSFELDGDKVTNVVYKYQQTATEGLEGTYKAETEQFGMTTVTISKTGDATLTAEDGTELTGNLSVYEGKYDLMVNNEDYSTSVDWIVEFKDDTFTYEEYQKTLYKEYAGKYTCTGPLGEFELNVDESGTATATVTIDGKAHEMTGNIVADYDSKTLNGVYLGDEEGNNLDVTLTDQGDGTWNYGGTISSSLY